MAPGRRKGPSKAAAMAAAKRNWKVGDLVLAKVKGFPAWPATVSEPSQWGYTSDRKKVLVYFFGTQQIAFCNHNDVEAFTEEKKKTLLVKRQGKGADFVRAVEEIIKSYEKLKEQCHGDESAGIDHSILSKARNAECLRGELLGSPRRSPQKETLNAYTEKVNNVEVRAAQLVVDDPSDVATLSENPNDSASILSQIREASAGVGSPLGKRENDESLVMQTRISSLRRCRSSLKVDPYRVQKSVMPPTDIHQPGTDVSPDVFMKHRLIKNSLNNSDSDNKNSYESDTVISYGNGDGIGSENIALESDSMDMNEGSTIDSYCETEDVSLSGRLDFGTTAVVFRKKRKPSKKRVVPDAAVCVGFNREETFQDGLSNSPSCSPNLCNNVDERVNKTDGDKHLPLVKRARARMSKPSVDENLLDDSFCNMEINQSIPEIGQKLTEEFSTYNSNDGTGSLSSASLVVTEAEKSLSISNGSMEVAENGSLLWKSKRYRVGFVDGEAVLPPSKRIHRALEAMSANVAEASNSSTEVQETSEILSNGRRSSPETASVHIPTESNIGTPLEAHNKQSFQSDILPEKASAHLSTDSNICCSLEAHYIQSSQSDISEVPAMTSLETTSDDILVEGIKIHQHCGEDVDKFRDDSSLAKKIDTGLSADRSSSFITYDMPDIDASSQSSLRHLSTEESNEEILPSTGGSSKDVTNKEIVCSKKGDFHVESEMETVMEKSDSLSKLKGVGNLMPVDGIPVSTLVQEGSSVICDSMHPSRSPSDVISGVNYMYDGMEEFKYQPVQRGMSFSTDLKSMKVLIAAAHAKRQLHRHFSLPHHVQDVVSDAYPHFNVDSSEKLYASGCMGSEIHGLGDWSKVLNSADRALDISLHEKSFVNSFNIDGEGRFDSRQNLDKFASRDEANVARKSFEAMLCVLSRTKESIGRATRLAIDCAKYGIAGEVVEILLRNLEEESSLNRKIDLFFLVDSITQCSRGQKGGPDAYPSLVQAALSRFLSAAAPPGHAALENRRQCMKVLRLWLERKTLPESVVRHHMRELDSVKNREGYE
ncbi:HUA2-like protein 2 [Acorus calamus]|uniref:HUA2-like protein 2 n=1 Tax=Acorus calamus TaxID=4465 RepID=A0AAV9F0E3_ACOCL|nr:HUA2-like protein 2 [Acorus calamus]